MILASYHYKAREVLPCLLIGNVGVGKTTSVRSFAQKVAEKLNKRFVFLNELSSEELLRLSENDEELTKVFPYLEIVASHLTPEFIQGLPHKIGDTYIMNTHIMVKILRKTQGMIFIDEILNVSMKDILSALLSLTLDKIFATIRINPDTIIISAGNPPKYSSLGRELSSANLDRFYVFQVEPSLEEWIQYNKNKVHPSVIAFLKENPTVFSLEITEDMIENFESISPRRWSKFGQDLKNLLRNGNNLPLVEKFVFMSLPQQIASRFILFVKSYLVDVENLTVEQYKILNMEQKDELIKNLANRFRVKLLDVKKENKKEVEDYLNKYTQLIEYIVKEDREIANIFLKVMDISTILKQTKFSLFKELNIQWFNTIVEYSMKISEKFYKDGGDFQLKSEG